MKEDMKYLKKSSTHTCVNVKFFYKQGWIGWL